MKVQALVVEEKDAPFRLQEVSLGEPGRGEALVRVVASGVCHTDAITRAGDKVIIGWPSCGECRNCLDGQPRYCLRTGDALVSGRRFKGELKGESAYSRDGQPINGHFFGQSSFATYSITSADALVKVTGDVP